MALGPFTSKFQLSDVEYFVFSGISLTNYRYYIQTVKYKSKETLFLGKIKCFLRKVLS